MKERLKRLEQLAKALSTVTEEAATIRGDIIAELKRRRAADAHVADDRRIIKRRRRKRRKAD